MKRHAQCAKKLLQPLLDTYEGTKITWTSLFLTSLTLTVYSNAHSSFGFTSQKSDKKDDAS